MAFTLLLNLLKGAAETVEEIAVEQELQALHDSNPAAWKAACDAGKGFASAIKTKSQFVQALLDGINEAVANSEAANPAPPAEPAPGVAPLETIPR